MGKIRTVLTGTVLAGALAGALAATPAQAAATTTAATAKAAFDRHGFGPVWSGYGRHESRGDRSYFKGYWYSKNGYYYFDGNLFDRDRDREYSYVSFQWHDNRGWHEKTYRGDRFGSSHFFGKFRKGSFDKFRIRVGEGTRGHYDWGTYRYFF
ncbi:hypothetical protein ABGB17_35185 [Sphaerisporangium sp. B11E5]|uniref:hypothetical protein n=1 Tax=Sphaerisporangium sp. B11E5 TaxID=3153563 RepID=UPI00325EA457